MNWKFWRREPDNFKVLGDILASQLAQASLFKLPKYSPESNLADAAKIVAFSRQTGYNAWAAEAWVEVIAQLKKLDLAKEQREIDQAVGALRTSLHLLRISYSAMSMVEKQAEASSTSTTLNRGASNGK